VVDPYLGVEVPGKKIADADDRPLVLAGGIHTLRIDPGEEGGEAVEVAAVGEITFPSGTFRAVPAGLPSQCEDIQGIGIGEASLRLIAEEIGIAVKEPRIGFRIISLRISAVSGAGVKPWYSTTRAMPLIMW
jgi:hypothetical protein